MPWTASIELTDAERRTLLAHFPMRSPSDGDAVLARIAEPVSMYRERENGIGWADFVPEPSKTTRDELTAIEKTVQKLASVLAMLADEPLAQLCFARIESRRELRDASSDAEVFAGYSQAQRWLGDARDTVADLASTAAAAVRRAERLRPPKTTRPPDYGSRFLVWEADRVWHDFAAEPMRRTDRGTGEPSKWERFLEAVLSVAGADTDGRRYAREIFDYHRRRAT